VNKYQHTVASVGFFIHIPDDGLCKPKHVAANVIVLNVLTVQQLK